MLNRIFTIILVALFSTVSASNYNDSSKLLIAWTDKAWSDYSYWQNKDRKKVKRINVLIKDIQKSNFSGIGKPEALKHELSEYWSRRIDGEHRIIYIIAQGFILIRSCRGHY